MELRINGKTMEKWSLEEMRVIINESEIYRENEYIDYKRNFAPSWGKNQLESNKIVN